MTQGEFIEKWNVAYESREQQIEFAQEMTDDLNALTASLQSELTRLKSENAALKEKVRAARNHIGTGLSNS